MASELNSDKFRINSDLSSLSLTKLANQFLASPEVSSFKKKEKNFFSSYIFL